MDQINLLHTLNLYTIIYIYIFQLENPSEF